jgi:hypothetical protein
MQGILGLGSFGAHPPLFCWVRTGNPPRSKRWWIGGRESSVRAALFIPQHAQRTRVEKALNHF